MLDQTKQTDRSETDLVYIREMDTDELEAELSAIERHGVKVELPQNGKLFSIHNANGERLAIVDSREAAFFAARQYEMQPVSVH